ncbi:MAG: SUMF1/EgtB/PvdO family nonheme iron enzyme [Phycisphaerae bacterium]
MKIQMNNVVAICVLLAFATVGLAITIETVPVGNAGNAADTRYGGCGSVSYAYNIGKYEVMAGQYTEFLNAVAKTDTYGLYNGAMWTDTTYGCRIQQTGFPGSYTYTVASGYANRPVNYVSYWDSLRFANWLGNGQGNGSTETGAYTLTSIGIGNNTIVRNAGATWAVTSEDEWYKAAYYNRSGSTYFDYPTSSNSIDTSKANYNLSVGHTTDVGSYNFPSPYGTFDQGGNVWEWNEAIRYDWLRVVRGGSFSDHNDTLHASYRYNGTPTNEYSIVGFRVSEVPEPASLAILVLGGIGALVRRRGVGSSE